MPNEPRPRSLLQRFGRSGTMLSEMSVFNFRAVVCVRVVAIQAPADDLAGLVGNAPAFTVGPRLPLLPQALGFGFRLGGARLRHAALKVGGVLGTGAKLDGALAVVVALHR